MVILFQPDKYRPIHLFSLVKVSNKAELTRFPRDEKRKKRKEVFSPKCAMKSKTSFFATYNIHKHIYLVLN